MFDAIIVGARGGGASLAMLLARGGRKVLLLEKGILSVEGTSAQYLHPVAVSQLQRWGLLPALTKSGCPGIQQTVLDVGEYQLKGRHLPIDGVAESFAPRGAILDSILVEAAVAAGVEFREGFTVSEILFAEGRVVGIRGQSGTGGLVCESARMVVGSDGMYSIVARSVKAPEYAQVEPLTCSFSSRWSGLLLEGLEIFPRAGRSITAFPTHDGLTQINVFGPRAEFREFRSDLEGNFLQTLERAPELAERVRIAKRVDGFVGTADTTNYFRVPQGPGWALVGDAGLHQDAITAHGLTNAWRDAEHLALALESGFSAQRSMEDALVCFHSIRDAMALPMYRLTCELAQLRPPDSQRQAQLDALRDDPAATARFFGVLAGTVAVEEFFGSKDSEDPRRHKAHPSPTPENLRSDFTTPAIVSRS